MDNEMELRNQLNELAKNEVDLQELKNQALAEMENNLPNAHIKVEFFKSYSRGGDCLPELKECVNAFLQSLACEYIVDVKFQVVRNFLLGSTLGEFEENGYAMVSYVEEEWKQ